MFLNQKPEDICRYGYGDVSFKSRLEKHREIQHVFENNSEQIEINRKNIEKNDNFDQEQEQRITDNKKALEENNKVDVKQQKQIDDNLELDKKQQKQIDDNYKLDERQQAEINSNKEKITVIEGEMPKLDVDGTTLVISKKNNNKV